MSVPREHPIVVNDRSRAYRAAAAILTVLGSVEDDSTATRAFLLYCNVCHGGHITHYSVGPLPRPWSSSATSDDCN